MRNEESGALEKRISKLSNEELLNMVEVEPHEYRKEALDYAKAELTVRGIQFQEARGSSDEEAGSGSASKMMRKVKTCKNVAEAGLLKELLIGSGIACEVRGEYLSMAVGELPFAECYPGLWVVGDEDFKKAKEILDEWDSKVVSQHENWICQRCGEENEGQFSSCWSCGWVETGSNDQTRA
jgi:putative signal transducing protein